MLNNHRGLPAGQMAQQGSGFDDVVQRAIGFAEKYRTELTPPIYAVWYTYAARENRAINETLDTAMNTDQPLTAGFMTALYQEHLSPRAISDEINDIGTDLTNTLGSVGQAMDENLKQHSAFTGTLRSVKQSLAVGSSKQEVNDVVKMLHKANQGHLQSAQRLAMQLEKNRSHVSKLKSELIEAKRASNTDYLTGLPNRRLLDETLDQRIFEARQRSVSLVILMASIGNLEAVTRDLGLSTGDMVMVQFAEHAREQLRGDQMVARFAGAKFTLVLPGLEKTGAFKVAEQLRRQFKSFKWAEGQASETLNQISVSFGGAVLRDGESREALMDRADRHLTRARREGADRSFIE